MHAPCESARQKTGYCSLNLFFQFFYTHDILYITKIDILNIHHIRYVRVFTSSHSPYCSHKTWYNTCSLAVYRLPFHYTSNADKIVSIFLNTQILDERRRFFLLLLCCAQCWGCAMVQSSRRSFPLCWRGDDDEYGDIDDMRTRHMHIFSKHQ